MIELRIFAFGSLFVASGIALQAQAPEMEWQRCLGGTMTEYSWGVQATNDGGFAVLGLTESSDGDVTGHHGWRDFWLVRLDANGELLWQRCYGSTGPDTPTRLLATSDEGYLLVGTAGSTDGDVTCGGSTNGKAWILKVDAAGDIQWQTCLVGDPDGSGAILAQAVETADGGYLVVGRTYADHGIWHENHGQSDMYAVKLNGAGQVQWLHCYGGSGLEDANTVRATPDGGYVIAGTVGSTDGQVTGSVGQIWVIKIDADGNLLWNRRMGANAGPNMGQVARDLVVNPDGSILVVGTVGANDGDISGNHGGHDVWLVLLDSSGAIMQQRCFGGSGWDTSIGGVAAGQGHYVIAGYTVSNDGDVSGFHGGDDPDAWVLKVDADLNLLWQKCLGGSHGDAAFAVVRTMNGGTVISGETVSNDGDVSGLHSALESDIWVVKLAPDVDAGITSPETKHIEVFPNPASNLVNVRFSGPLPANTALDIVDVTGRVVLHRNLDLGIQSMQVPVDGWASGLYGIRLNMGNAKRTLRFVKQ